MNASAKEVRAISGTQTPWVQCVRCNRVMHGPSGHRCNGSFRKRKLLWSLAEPPGASITAAQAAF
jgi:hypothetical protein